MATQEFYIRNASDTEARGPFNLEQLGSLAENGQVTPDTVYYDAGKEQWIAIGSDAELLAVLFPEKKRLRVKAKDQVQSLNVSSESAPPIEVGDMLAAAEGRSADTKDKADPTDALARSARISMYFCSLMLLVSAAALIAPSIDTIVERDYLTLLSRPFVWFGVLDVFLFLMLMLQAVSVYPLIRLRAAIGAGFFGLMFYVQGDTHLALAAIVGSAGIYLSTVFINFSAVLLAAALGIGGIGFFAYSLLIS